MGTTTPGKDEGLTPAAQDPVSALSLAELTPPSPVLAQAWDASWGDLMTLLGDE